MFEQIRKSLKGRASCSVAASRRHRQSVRPSGLGATGPGFNTTVPSQIMDQFRNQRILWTTNVWVYANTLFGILAVIEFAWSAAVMLLEKSDLQSWTSALIRKLMWIGAFYALLLNGRIWIPAIIDSFTQIGQNAAGLGALSPSGVFIQGLSLAGALMDGASTSAFLHQPRHVAGASVCGSADCYFVHAHHDQLHCHAGRKLSGRIGRLHLSRLRWKPMDGAVHGTIHRPGCFHRHQDPSAVLPDLRRIRPEPRLDR